MSLLNFMDCTPWSQHCTTTFFSSLLQTHKVQRACMCRSDGHDHRTLAALKFLGAAVACYEFDRMAGFGVSSLTYVQRYVD